MEKNRTWYFKKIVTTNKNLSKRFRINASQEKIRMRYFRIMKRQIKIMI